MHNLPPTPSVDVLNALSVQRLSHGVLFWVLQVGGWTAYGLTIAAATVKVEPPMAAVFDTLLYVVSGFAVTTMSRYIFRILRRRSFALPYVGLSIVLAAIVGAPLVWELQAVLAHAVARFHPSWVATIPSYTNIPLEDWMGWSTPLIGWSLLYFGINNWISLQAARHRAYVAEAAAQKARALALQAQLQPHFLFNTLNSVSALMLNDRGREAAQMIAGLGTLLRMSMQSADSALIPLARELDFVRQYLEIEKMRFGERMNYRFEIASDATNALVPTLLLQPLVENALRHGILSQRVGGLIVIRAFVEEGMVKLQVSDDGRGWHSKISDSPGIGLANTARRLGELFGARGRLKIAQSESGGVTVDIALPFESVICPGEARERG